ncbi:MAG: RteC domain-containing protein [Prevotella sp.]|jgi:hypothetical protein|nr:RteC domain-containing protein [Prevotella sp.]
MSKQVLEWRITAPNNNVKCIPENNLSFSHNGLFSQYMDNKLLGMDTVEQSPFIYPKIRMTWTGNKVDLVELIYAWEAACCFNNGNVSIKEVVAYIEIVFNIDLGDYYHTFRELRRRVNRTAFLDKLTKFLNDRMDEADSKN